MDSKRIFLGLCADFGETSEEARAIIQTGDESGSPEVIAVWVKGSFPDIF